MSCIYECAPRIWSRRQLWRGQLAGFGDSVICGRSSRGGAQARTGAASRDLRRYLGHGTGPGYAAKCCVLQVRPQTNGVRSQRINALRVDRIRPVARHRCAAIRGLPATALGGAAGFLPCRSWNLPRRSSRLVGYGRVARLCRRPSAHAPQASHGSGGSRLRSHHHPCGSRFVHARWQARSRRLASPRLHVVCSGFNPLSSAVASACTLSSNMRGTLWPNHSIEATAQSPLRARWSAPHVKR